MSCSIWNRSSASKLEAGNKNLHPSCIHNKKAPTTRRQPKPSDYLRNGVVVGFLEHSDFQLTCIQLASDCCVCVLVVVDNYTM